MRAFWLMRGAAPFVLVLMASGSLAGCLEQGAGTLDARPGPSDPWQPPERSAMAASPYYDLDRSTTFLAKGVGYVRYVVRVVEPIERVNIYFTTGNGQSNAPAPSIGDDRYHYEFMQIRRLGQEVHTLDSNAATQYRHGSTGHTFTLTYIYGRGADYQYLAPFDGDPASWGFEAGFYDLVIATDENLTVGINLDVGSTTWATRYHPQELGSSRAAALGFHADIVQGPSLGDDPYQASLFRSLSIGPTERLNLFAFSDLIYDSQAALGTVTATLEAQGEAWLRVGDEEINERLGFTTAQPQRNEAFAYAAFFNEAGPLVTSIHARVNFDEVAAAQSTRLAMMLVFAVATRAEQTVDGIPDPTAPETF